MEYDPAVPNDYEQIKRSDPSMRSDLDGDPKPSGVADSKIGSKLLKKMGWTEGQGLGKQSQGQTEPLVARKVGQRQAVVEFAKKLE